MDRLTTRVAKAGWGDHRFRGHAVYADLLGHTSLTQLLAMALGFELNSDEAAFFDELVVSSTLADPHIWPLKLTRVAGAHGGSVVTGLAAGMISSDGPLMGAGAVGPTAEWLAGLVEEQQRGVDVLAGIRETIAVRGRMPGFGVPARRVDERVVTIARCIEARGRGSLRHWALWSAIVEETRKKKLEPNLASAFAAAALDLGFPPNRVALGMHLCLLPSYLANAVEGADQRPEVLVSVPAVHLTYRGSDRRRSYRASVTTHPPDNGAEHPIRHHPK